jgi:hypothetical protein
MSQFYLLRHDSHGLTWKSLGLHAEMLATNQTT